jgi:hypothetical protein
MEVPFPPSWIDRLIAWIDRASGPTWLIYVLGALVLALLANAIFWIDGGLPLGSIDQLITIFSILALYWLALYHYLTRVGSRSLIAFRPLLAAADSEMGRIDYELATLPRWLGWLSIPLGLGVSAATLVGDPAPFGDLVAQTALPYVFDFVITWFLICTFLCLIIRSIRQLMMVRKLHARATNINLLKLDPAHAFAALTSRTSIGMILLLIIAFLPDPTEFSTTMDMVDITLTSMIFAVSIGVFVLPVIGIRDQLDQEKQRVLDEINTLLQAASDQLHKRVRDVNYQDIGDARNAIEALIHEREFIEKISTWPWDPRTLRGFASALILPIFLWLVTRLLEDFF